MTDQAGGTANSLRTMIISPDPDLALRLRGALGQFEGYVAVSRVLDCYPEPNALAKALRAHAPAVVFLDFQQPAEAVSVAKALCLDVPGLQVVAVHRECDPALLRESMRAGIREVLTPPFEAAALTQALANVVQNLDRCPVAYAATENVLAFLPSKAGAGATSLALSVSGAMARGKSARVFLGDLDLNSGTLRFLLNLGKEASATDAVQCDDMDEQKWPGFVTPVGNLDVLHAGRVNPNIRLESRRAVDLIHFLRRNYHAVCFDFSGNLERYSIDVMQEARHLILVCTPEIPSLHLAREKLTFLAKADLDKRVLIVLNRMNRRPAFSSSQIQDVLEAPVLATISNDYAAFHQAVRHGTLIDFHSQVGRECVALADKLLHQGPPGQNGRHKYLQFFALQKTKHAPLAARLG